MSGGTIIILCLVSFIIGTIIGDERASKRDELFTKLMLDDHQEDIKLLTNKIVELQQKCGGEK